MSGRLSRQLDISQRTQYINDDDAWEKRRIVLQNLHDAAQIGNVSTVKQIFETYAELHIDITRRGRNTTLHTAISHNQEGPIIDYLIKSGADINVENSKGQCPLTMAIIYCKRGSKAFEKLIHAGAKTSFNSGAFSGMSAMDVAAQYKNEHVINFLNNQLMDEKDICKEVLPTAATTKQQKSKYRATCPICNELVTYPTKMSRIEVDQMNIEQRIQNDGDYVNGGKAKTNRRKYITRKYLDKLLAHSNGQVYKKLCGIEYHGVENMRLRKEISESFGILHAVHACCVSLGITAPTNDDEDIKFDNIFLIDLCSGKGITTAICGAMNGNNNNDNNGKNNYFLAIDRMLDHTIPHFLNKDQVHYMCRDIMAESMFDEISTIVQQQTQEYGRTCILVGMHLCGILSEQAIDLYDRTSNIKGIVLSPCCLPRKCDIKKTRFTKDVPKPNEEVELFNYKRWAEYLKNRVEESHSNENDVSGVRLYTDAEMHTEKNTIIVATKQ